MITVFQSVLQACSLKTIYHIGANLACLDIKNESYKSCLNLFKKAESVI